MPSDASAAIPAADLAGSGEPSQSTAAVETILVFVAYRRADGKAYAKSLQAAYRKRLWFVRSCGVH
jgi:hypothetical protein